MKTFGMWSAMAGAALAITACATPYQNMGMLGGVEAHPISDDTIQIVAKGNAYTETSTIQRYALRKAAEETLAHGYDYFAVVNGSDDSRRGSAGSAFGGRGWLFGSSWEMLKPGDILLVKMLHGPQPDPLPPNVYRAQSVEVSMTTGAYVPKAPKP